MHFLQQLNATFATGKTSSLQWRRSQLLALKQLLLENEQKVYAALKQDLNKCEFEAYASEYAYVLKDIKVFLKNLKKWSKPSYVGTPVIIQPGNSKIQPEPYGTVLIMGAWNYPIQLILSPMVAAIAAGNCVVLKPSELASATSELLAELVPKYMDNDAVHVYQGGIEETTELLKQRFDYIMYTGSEMVGKVVMRAAAEHLTPVTLELGGKSPCIVDDDTNLKVTADRIVWGKFLNAGQTCIAPDYILVTENQKQPLITALKTSLKKQLSDSPKDSDDYGRIINQRHFARLMSYLDGLEEHICHGGQSDDNTRFIAPTLLLDPPLDAPVMTDEIFGPILPIITVDSVNHAIEFINQREKPLALYLFSSNQKTIEQVQQRTSSGTLCINDAVVFMANANLPFGGVGNSGMGSYHGKWGFDTFSHLKPILHRSFIADAPIRYAPFTDLKLKLFKWISKI